MSMNLPKLIVFDLDGVLVDVSRSYLETVRKTALLFLRPAKGGDVLPDPLFSLDDLLKLKQTGGLNNDWDLTAQALSLLFAKVETPRSDSDAISSYQRSLEETDLSTLAQFLKSSPQPLTELLASHGKRQDAFVASCYQGEVGGGNVIKQIFQEIYLGEHLFLKVYGFAPRFYRGPGLIHEERLLPTKDFLEFLAAHNILAIATGRPRVEAEYTLDHFQISDFFRDVVCLDDCLREEERIFQTSGEKVSLSKPHPYMLDLIARREGNSYEQCFYLGDMPDDMAAAAASRAGFRGIGVTFTAPDKEGLRKELRRNGAFAVIDEFTALPELIG